MLRHSTPSSADELAVDRRAEYENSVRAAAAGVGAPVIEFLPDDGVLVIGFLEGETLSDEHLQRPGHAAAGGRRLPTAARRPGVRQPLRHVRAPARVPGGCSAAAFAFRRATSTTPGPWSGSAPPWPSSPWRCGPATTTCWPPTSSTTAGRCGSSTTSTRGTTTPTSSSATSGASAISRSSSWRSWCRRTTGPLPGATWRAPACGASCRSTAGRCGRPFRTAPARSTSTSGAWGMEKYERAEATFAGPDLERLLVDVTRAD